MHCGLFLPASFAHCRLGYQVQTAYRFAEKMGAVKKFPYPKYVWSPAGGWWCNPRNWKRNTAIAAAINFAIWVPVAYMSWQLERRPVPPYRHIPSQKLAKYAKVDDPSLL